MDRLELGLRLITPLVVEGIEATVFSYCRRQCSLWESVLPEELRRRPEELSRVDALVDDQALCTPYVPFFDPRMGSAVHTDGNLFAVDGFEISLPAGL
jgi:IS5 family transposase